MKTRLTLTALVMLTLATLNLPLSTAHAQGTAFAYQGRLNEGGAPANGAYDLRFKLFVDPLANNQAGSAVLTNGVPVANGLFLVALDFGAGIFAGSNYWLEVDVKTNGGAAYTELGPLQSITPTPYAIFAENIGSGGLPAGTYGSAFTFDNAANSFSGSFAGNGAGVTNVNAFTLDGLGAGAFWQLGGNNVAGGQFLGSTNNQPVEIWVSQSRALRLEPGNNTNSVIGAPNVIGGAPNNVVDANIYGATIAGGGALNMTGFLPGPSSNHVAAIFGTIAGGRLNTVGADHGFIGGGILNTIQQFTYDSVIGGGYDNLAQSNGFRNVIGGGDYNTIQQYADHTVIAGGGNNTIVGSSSQSVYSTISGGLGNNIQTNVSYGFIGGGTGNSIQAGSSYAAIAGGANNRATGPDTVVSGGIGNTASAYFATVGGGNINTASAAYTTIAGGFNNTASGSYATVSGGYGNSNLTYAAAIGGGEINAIQTNSDYSFIGGGGTNNIQTNSGFCVLGGGYNNAIGPNSYDSFLGGGGNNYCYGFTPTLAGGYGNSATNDYATVSGGSGNAAGGGSATVGGGQINSAAGIYATVSGGYSNTVSGYGATVGGGAQNTASGSYATVGGGYQNAASGQYSLAAGANAQALYDNSFVWSDGTTFSSTTYNQFAVSAAGGVWLEANVQVGTGTSDYRNLALGGGNSTGYLYGSYQKWGDGVHLGYNYYADAGGTGHILNGGGGTSRITAGYGEIILAVGGVDDVPTNVMLHVTTSGVCVNGTVSNCSDRNVKQDFASIDSSQILDGVLRLPVSEWSYKVDPKTRHVGPMAQDFYSAFNVGIDDKHIAPIDEGGLAFAAIQGLNQKVESENAALRAENAELKARLQKIEQLIYSIQGQQK